MKTKKLLKLRQILKVTQVVAAIAVFIGFFMIIGGVGNFDYADEVHMILTEEQEAKAWTICIIGCIAMGAGAGILAGCERVCENIEIELHRRHKRAIERKKAHQIETKAKQDNIIRLMQELPNIINAEN
jgi:hypothetical protein